MQRSTHLDERGPNDRGAGNQKEIPPRLDRLAAQRLTQQPLGPIAHNGAADLATGHDGGPGLRFRRGKGAGRDHNNKRVGVRSSFTPHPLDIGCAS